MHPTPWAPEGGKADGVMDIRLGCNDLFLVSDYTQLKDGKPGFIGHGVYGWDAKESCCTMYWFDSMTPGGFVTPARGTWEGDVLTFRHREPQHVRYVYTFGGDGSLAFRIEMSQHGDAWKCFMEAKYTTTH